MLIPPVYAALGENVRHLLRHELDPQGQRDTDYRGTRHRSHGPKEYPVPRSQAHETLRIMTTIIMRTSEGDMRMMLLLWDATSGNKSLRIVEIPIKTAPRTLNNPDFPEK